MIEMQRLAAFHSAARAQTGASVPQLDNAVFVFVWLCIASFA
jgi:hypothetical protein